MSNESTIGARLRALRRWRGMTQVQLAGLAGLSQPFLSQVEQGQRALDRRSHIAALAGALRVSETDLVGGPHLSADPVQAGAHAPIPALRLALETNTFTAPACTRARPLPDLVAEMNNTMKPLFYSGDFIELGIRLPAIIDELHVHIADPKDEPARRLSLETLIEACNYATFRSKDLGYFDLAHIAARCAGDAAKVLDDPVQKGKAEFIRIQTMPKAGSWDRVLTAAERAANQLEPQVDDPLGIQTLGMLTLSSAMAAAAAYKGDVADNWLDAAEELAGRVPNDPLMSWSGFCLTSVDLWRITVSVEHGTSGGRLLEQAKNMDEGKLALRPSWQAIFLAEVGRGLARDKRTRSQAVQWLRRAEDIAPQRIRNNGAVHHALEVLHEHPLPSAVGVELRGMMARMGIPH